MKFNERVWARISQDGDVSLCGDTIGPYFFSNAKQDKAKIVRAIVQEVPMTTEELRAANVCECCGQPLPGETDAQT